MFPDLIIPHVNSLGGLHAVWWNSSNAANGISGPAISAEVHAQLTQAIAIFCQANNLPVLVYDVTEFDLVYG